MPAHPSLTTLTAAAAAARLPRLHSRPLGAVVARTLGSSSPQVVVPPSHSPTSRRPIHLGASPRALVTHMSATPARSRTDRRGLSTYPGIDPSPSDPEPTINLSFSTLASLVVTSTLGLLLGSLAAVGLSHALEATGVFAYVDEDDEGDRDADEGRIDDGNANVVIGNVDLTFAANEVANVGKGGEEAEDVPLVGIMARRLALEATGDLSVGVTVNLHRWDPAARAFQLMQLKSFLHALDDALHTTQPDGTHVPVVLDADTANEVAAVRAFAVASVARIEARLKSELVARPPDAVEGDGEGAVVSVKAK